MTVVEVMVAGMILVAGGLGVLGMVDTASRNTFGPSRARSSRLLQQEIEKLRQVPYEEPALTSLPAQTADPANPNSRVASSALLHRAQQHRLEADERWRIGRPRAGPFQVDDVKGTVSRYVVWDNCPSALCADGGTSSARSSSSG